MTEAHNPTTDPTLDPTVPSDDSTTDSTTTTEPSERAASSEPEIDLAPYRERVFDLYCQGHRSPSIARQINASERTVRSWIAATLKDLAQEHTASRQEQLQAAIARQQAISANAWANYEHLIQVDQTLLDEYYAALKSYCHDEPFPAPPRPSALAARYLAIAAAAQREINRLQGLYLNVPPDPKPVKFIVEMRPDGPENIPPPLDDIYNARDDDDDLFADDASAAAPRPHPQPTATSSASSFTNPPTSLPSITRSPAETAKSAAETADPQKAPPHISAPYIMENTAEIPTPPHKTAAETANAAITTTPSNKKSTARNGSARVDPYPAHLRPVSSRRAPINLSRRRRNSHISPPGAHPRPRQSA